MTPLLTHQPIRPELGDVVRLSTFRSSKPLPLVDRTADWFEDWSGNAMIDMVSGNHVRFIGEDGHWGWVNYGSTEPNPIVAIVKADAAPSLDWSDSALHFLFLEAE